MSLWTFDSVACDVAAGAHGRACLLLSATSVGVFVSCFYWPHGLQLEATPVDLFDRNHGAAVPGAASADAGSRLRAIISPQRVSPGAEDFRVVISHAASAHDAPFEMRVCACVAAADGQVYDAAICVPLDGAAAAAAAGAPAVRPRVATLTPRAGVVAFDGEFLVHAAVAAHAGSMLIFAGAHGLVEARHAHTGALQARLAGPSEAIFTLCLSPDGRFVLGAGHDDPLHVWALPPPDEPQEACVMPRAPLCTFTWPTQLCCSHILALPPAAAGQAPRFVLSTSTSLVCVCLDCHAPDDDQAAGLRVRLLWLGCRDDYTWRTVASPSGLALYAALLSGVVRAVSAVDGTTLLGNAFAETAPGGGREARLGDLHALVLAHGDCLVAVGAAHECRVVRLPEEVPWAPAVEAALFPIAVARTARLLRHERETNSESRLAQLPAELIELVISFVAGYALRR